MVQKALVRCLVFALVLSSFACRPPESPEPTQPDLSHELQNALLWAQTSAEFVAVCRQTYALAALRLEAALADPAWSALPGDAGGAERPPAVILDVDETVLDNSPYDAQLAKDGIEHTSALWKEWVDKQEARPIPGALEFVESAHDRGVKIFYVTNRNHELEESTRGNLEKAGFPVDDDRDVVLTRNEEGWDSNKTPRRELVGKDFRVLLLIGDNLGDFVASHLTPAERRALVDTYDGYWGTKWIVVPNPAYGDWASALYGYEYSLPREQKLEKQRSYLKTFRP